MTPPSKKLQLKTASPSRISGDMPTPNLGADAAAGAGASAGKGMPAGKAMGAKPNSYNTLVETPQYQLNTVST